MNGSESSRANQTEAINDFGSYFLIAFMVLLIILTIVGNIFVITAILIYKPLRSVQNFFLISLALADLAVAIIVMPFHISNTVLGFWSFGEHFCDIWLTCDIMLCTASILNICAIALDRYFAIHDPINYASKRTTKRVMTMILIVWGLSAVISVPPLFGWSNTNDGTLYDYEFKTCHLTDEKGYVVYSACGSFYIPLLIMSFVYMKIFLATRQRLRRRAKASAASKMVLLKTKPKTVKAKLCEQNSDNSNDESMAQEGTSSTSRNTQPLVNGELHNETSNMAHFFEQKQKISLSKEKKAARTLGIIMGAFVFCWLPFFLVYIIMPFCTVCDVSGTYVEITVVIVGYVNSSLNPIIYTLFNVEFRKAFHFICQRHFGCNSAHKQYHFKKGQCAKL
ncbi:hypothetical protein FSP39_001579 [Pinctada imbricata]|uniref:G-protein coupled receptors family 1 profile domain-containing protein n=1 Tax=Pinctada imbricata TaxID=66713 RepID=A0AA88Y1W1_PINIB|nr:hypothetical protein FSP39_001579 [Pinctada imbricata]